jgi:beta-glucanase (GH16 family)
MGEMFRSLRAFVCVIALLSLCATSRSAEPKKPQSGDASVKRFTLVWSDEFNGPDGSAPDPTKWTAVTNDSGYGNRELEFYTPRPENVHQQNGSLVITARREAYTGSDGQSRSYTSARLESRGLFDLKYGRVEARIKIPKGQGIWPAFWMLGTNFEQVGWPACGEVDIMENVGIEPSKVHGSLHGPGYSGGSPLTGVYTLPDQAHFSDDFHVFAIEWEPRIIRFYVDGTLFETQSADSVPAGRWAFDHSFYLVLNVAVGGYWPGDPDATTEFPQSMLVDWVRVYKTGDDRAQVDKP